MKKTILLAAALGSTALLSACNQKDQTGTAETPKVVVAREDAVAIVNGRPISKLSVEILEKELTQRRGSENVSKEKIVDELIKREVLRQSAEKDQLTKQPSVAARLENAERMVLSQIAAEHLIDKLALTDEEIKKEYDQRIGAMKTVEYKARHILVDSEKLAKEIIAKLQKKEKFADLAKKYSKDPGSKGEGGELGWFNPQQMVGEFSSAVVALKNGEFTKSPVHSQFGWHVIEREDSREQAPPPFEAVKEQLVSLMQTQKLHQYIEELKSQAKIERLTQPEPKPVEPGPAQPAGGAPSEAGAGTTPAPEGGSSAPAKVPAAK